MKRLNTSVRTTELDDTSDRLLQLYTGEAALKDEAFLKPLFVEMQALSDKITEAIRRDKIFSDLEDADAERDGALSKIFKIVDGYRAMPVATMSEPAERLLPVVAKFRGTARQNYTTESSLIEAMLSDLSATQPTADIAALPGLAEAVALLRDAQTNFNTKRTTYEKALGGQTYAESASTYKKPLLELINGKLLPYLEVMNMADPAKYASLAAAAASAIESTNAAVKARSTAKPKPQA